MKVSLIREVPSPGADADTVLVELTGRERTKLKKYVEGSHPDPYREKESPDDWLTQRDTDDLIGIILVYYQLHFPALAAEAQDNLEAITQYRQEGFALALRIKSERPEFWVGRWRFAWGEPHNEYVPPSPASPTTE